MSSRHAGCCLVPLPDYFQHIRPIDKLKRGAESLVKDAAGVSRQPQCGRAGNERPPLLGRNAGMQVNGCNSVGPHISLMTDGMHLHACIRQAEGL